ncbi:MAG TPA: SDR family oxidoreductase [Micromonosporaceae bacterium]|nr:SDR family oxidoreductase [Micromonosporaceae bacterium]
MTDRGASDRRRTALITGATAGIGAAFARQLGAQGYDLVLVARDQSRLTAAADELSAAHGVRVTVLATDLSTAEGCAPVEALLAVPAGSVDVIDLLVNNAGLTLNRSFLRTSAADEARLLGLNVNAVMRLTHAALPGMVERRSGGIINVSSASGFAAVMPGSTYPASKAWVRHFSESMGLAVAQFGVRVMALAPGYTRTEFHERARIDMSKTPRWMWLDADDVVRAALRDFRRGRLVSVPDWRYKAAVFAMRHTPQRLVHRVSSDTRGRIGRDEVDRETAGR